MNYLSSVTSTTSNWCNYSGRKSNSTSEYVVIFGGQNIFSLGTDCIASSAIQMSYEQE